jgi:hypothetical protein
LETSKSVEFAVEFGVEFAVVSIVILVILDLTVALVARISSSSSSPSLTIGGLYLEDFLFLSFFLLTRVIKDYTFFAKLRDICARSIKLICIVKCLKRLE